MQPVCEVRGGGVRQQRAWRVFANIEDLLHGARHEQGMREPAERARSMGIMTAWLMGPSRCVTASAMVLVEPAGASSGRGPAWVWSRKPEAGGLGAGRGGEDSVEALGHGAEP